MSSARDRIMALWVPDWPVHAHLAEQAGRTEDGAAEHAAAPDPGGLADQALPPLALVTKHRVVACSGSARAEGVRLGIRDREAQLRCPDVQLHPHDPAVDARRFAPVIAAVEQLVPEVEELRPGLCAVRARGPARYYGGEAPAAERLLALAHGLGFSEARVGVADGRFTAEQAARSDPSAPGVSAHGAGVRVVASEATVDFLSGMPVARAVGRELAEVLGGLGIRTLGALAALPEQAVEQRFGPAGVAAHRLASGRMPTREPSLRPRTPPRELGVELAFEPPVDGSDRLAFACSALVDRFVSTLREEGLVCTELSIELSDDIGLRHERGWAHPHHFDGADVLNRVRWQATGLPRDPDRTGAGVVRVRIVPTRTDRASAHEPGLWDSGSDPRVHHRLSRVQSLVGHEGVVTAELAGGRLLRDRQRWHPWGSRGTGIRGAGGTGSRAARPVGDGPWPGALTTPAPTLVFDPPLPAECTDDAGEPVGVDPDDERLDRHPTRLRVPALDARGRVCAWSAPWPLRERWWQGTPARFRLQLQLQDGDAWLLLLQRGAWFAEGRYD